MIVFGGCDDSDYSEDQDAFILDLKNGSLKKLSQTYQRHGHTACLISDQIYLFGYTKGNRKFNNLNNL